MNPSHVVFPRAILDLDEHARYLAEAENIELGLRFLDAAQETFVLLASHPGMGWPARNRHPELTDLRLFRVDGFHKMLILYRPRADGVILRVIHGSRNLQGLLRRREEIE